MTDSTGIKFLGDGEWQARKHGPQGQRQWRKVHLAMDPATSDIRAVEFTLSRDGDGPVLPDLLSQIPAGEQIGTVTAPSRQIALQSLAGQWVAPMTRAAATRPSSGVMLSRSFRSAETDVCGRRTARRHASGRNPARHPILWPGLLETLDGLSRPKSGRSETSRDIAAQCTAGHWMRCLKAFGERIAARDPDRQIAEIEVSSASPS
ncbi:IS5 family transposase ISRhba5 [Pseudooceanicola algae]|uniref:IS5 family transposase ISRhba5 n=1 Tax=Pseudooceanicola algae TaxID=1537215 RepID=A0A418SEC7_9RHOB|nr:IS5 family transposase ISRhba5 [Pseudooceanicola algae]